MAMSTLFISDLHLQANSPHLTAKFLEFLQDYAAKADTLYILGDLFELWLGDDLADPFQLEIMQRLKSYTQKGNRLYVLPGNRDFLMNTKFATQTGCTLLSDPTVINLYGEKILLTHGDLLCSQDKSHQWFRRISRNLFIQSLFYSLPKSLRHYLGMTIRKKSKNNNRLKAAEILDAQEAAFIALMRRYTVKSLIHGHTHRPSIEFLYKPDMLQRIVLSDWGILGNGLECTAEGNKRLFYF